MKKYYVYRLSWAGTDKVYVGCTWDPEGRFRKHCSLFNPRPTHYTILETSNTKAEVLKLEYEWILHYHRLGRSLNKTVGFKEGQAMPSGYFFLNCEITPEPEAQNTTPPMPRTGGVGIDLTSQQELVLQKYNKILRTLV